MNRSEEAQEARDTFEKMTIPIAFGSPVLRRVYRIPIVVDDVSTMTEVWIDPLQDAGKLRLEADTSSERTIFLKDLPTIPTEEVALALAVVRFYIREVIKSATEEAMRVVIQGAKGNLW